MVDQGDCCQRYVTDVTNQRDSCRERTWQMSRVNVSIVTKKRDSCHATWRSSINVMVVTRQRDVRQTSVIYKAHCLHRQTTWGVLTSVKTVGAQKPTSKKLEPENQLVTWLSPAICANKETYNETAITCWVPFKKSVFWGPYLKNVMIWNLSA